MSRVTRYDYLFVAIATFVREISFVKRIFPNLEKNQRRKNVSKKFLFFFCFFFYSITQKLQNKKGQLQNTWYHTVEKPTCGVLHIN